MSFRHLWLNSNYGSTYHPTLVTQHLAGQRSRIFVVRSSETNFEYATERPVSAILGHGDGVDILTRRGWGGGTNKPTRGGFFWKTYCGASGTFCFVLILFFFFFYLARLTSRRVAGFDVAGVGGGRAPPDRGTLTPARLSFIEIRVHRSGKA